MAVLVDLAAARAQKDATGTVEGLRAELAEAERDAADAARREAQKLELNNPLRADWRLAVRRMLDTTKPRFDKPVAGLALPGELIGNEIGLDEHDARPGAKVLVLPALDPYAPGAIELMPAVLGLLAASPRDERWWAWYGRAAPGLGWIEGPRLRLHATPLGWLRGGLAAQRRWREEYERRRADVLTERAAEDPEFAPTDQYIASITPEVVTMPAWPKLGPGRMWLDYPPQFAWTGLYAKGVRTVIADDATHARTLWELWPKTARKTLRMEVLA